MNYAIHRFSLDINKDEPSQIILSAKRGDTAKLLIISLLADKHDYVIDKDSYASLTGKKQNGVTFEHSCIIDLKNNKIEYSFESSTVSSTGKIDCELNLFNELGERLTTSRFTIIVHETIFSADISDAEDDISALTQLRSELNALLQTVQKKLDNGEFVGEKGEKGADGTVAFEDLTEEQRDSLKGENGAGIVSTEFEGKDANGGNIYKQTFADGKTATFVAPKGDKGDKGEQGVQGEKGEKGEKGDTPSLVSETWTFTLEDGTTINKKVVVV